MQTRKEYVIDTNVLIKDPEALFKLRNGNDNPIYVPYHVLMELDKFKRNPKFCNIVARIIQNLSDHPDQFTVLKSEALAGSFANNVDNHILEEIEKSGLQNPVLVTNDRIFQLQAGLRGISSEIYNESVSFEIEAEQFTGFIQEGETPVPNSFCWFRGRPLFYGPDGEKPVDYQHKVWNVSPKNVYQNLALELMRHPDIHVVSLQSAAGYGKTYLALASALFLTLQQKWHDKIYVIKPMIEIGQKLGYLPGKLSEKMAPYTRYISDLLLKLHRIRPANKLFINAQEQPPIYDSRRFELLPLSYIRGMNLENAVVIVDEMQNLTRMECRALLSRMGEGVKCFCLGDIHQVDNPYLNAENNGLNWLVKKFKGNRIYGHLVLKGDRSRGPITDLVIKTGL